MSFGVGVQDDDDDPVIATYNVYASPSLQNHLHIFQFPLRRKFRPYEASDVRLFATEGIVGEGHEAQQQQQQSSPSPDGSILTHSSRLTMHCRLDTFGSSSFDQAKQESEASAPLTAQHQQQTLKHSYAYALQSHPFQSRCDYAVGFIADGSIHLTPVSTVQQFTPIVQPSRSPSAHCVDTAFASVTSTPLVPGLALSDRIQRDLTRQRSAVLNADAATAREMDSFAVNAVESLSLRRRLRSATVETAAIHTSSTGTTAPLSRMRAEDSLFPPELLLSGGITGGDGAAVESGALLRRYADRYSAAAQVRAQMRGRHVATLASLRSAITPPASDEALLSALRSEAVWAHGVWIAKRAARLTGAAAALRELVLLRFYKSPTGCLARAGLNALVGTAPLRRAVREVLASVAELVPGEADPARRVWRLRLVPGDGAEAYPQEAAFQRAQWARAEALIEAHAGAVAAGLPVARLVLAAGRGAEEPAARAHPAAKAPPPTPARDEDTAPIVRYVRRLFLEHGVVNKQRAKEMVLKAKPRHFPDATNATLSAALQQSVQTFTSATWVLKTRGEPEVDRHRPLILEAVLELTNFETRSLNALLAEKRERLGLTGEDEEGRQRIVSRVLSEVAEFKTHERLWSLKSGNVIAE